MFWSRNFPAPPIILAYGSNTLPGIKPGIGFAPKQRRMKKNIEKHIVHFISCSLEGQITQIYL